MLKIFFDFLTIDFPPPSEPGISAKEISSLTCLFSVDTLWVSTPAISGVSASGIGLDMLASLEELLTFVVVIEPLELPLPRPLDRLLLLPLPLPPRLPVPLSGSGLLESGWGSTSSGKLNIGGAALFLVPLVELLRPLPRPLL